MKVRTFEVERQLPRAVVTAPLSKLPVFGTIFAAYR